MARTDELLDELMPLQAELASMDAGDARRAHVEHRVAEITAKIESAVRAEALEADRAMALWGEPPGEDQDAVPQPLYRRGA